jgi:hypothetical protein
MYVGCRIYSAFTKKLAISLNHESFTSFLSFFGFGAFGSGTGVGGGGGTASLAFFNWS